MVGFLIQPLKDFNEITYHMVHVVHSQLALQKGAPVVREGRGREGRGEEGRGEEEREGRVRDGMGMEGKEGREGKGREREEMQRGQLKERECRRVEVGGGGKLEGSRCQLVCSHRCFQLMQSHHCCSFHSPPPPLPPLPPIARAVQ